MQAVSSKVIEIYMMTSGRKPFVEWLESLDIAIRYRIKERLDRVTLGNLGDWGIIDEGVSELRFNINSGYLIYYSEIKNSTILLLCGGNKATQNKDIKKAIKLWKDYLSR